MGEDIVVTSVGVVAVTVNGSHGLVAGLLLVSPLYVAFQLKEPSEVKVTGVESGTLLLTTLTVNVKAAGPTLQVLVRSEEHTAELQSRPHLGSRLLLVTNTEPPIGIVVALKVLA